jgi:hypothetical protein
MIRLPRNVSWMKLRRHSHEWPSSQRSAVRERPPIRHSPDDRQTQGGYDTETERPEAIDLFPLAIDTLEDVQQLIRLLRPSARLGGGMAP